jgi:hypothetical protein
MDLPHIPATVRAMPYSYSKLRLESMKPGKPFRENTRGKPPPAGPTMAPCRISLLTPTSAAYNERHESSDIAEQHGNTIRRRVERNDIMTRLHPLLKK